MICNAPVESPSASSQIMYPAVFVGNLCADGLGHYMDPSRAFIAVSMPLVVTGVAIRCLQAGLPDIKQMVIASVISALIGEGSCWVAKRAQLPIVAPEVSGRKYT